jgi:hypothetical protein
MIGACVLTYDTTNACDFQSQDLMEENDCLFCFDIGLRCEDLLMSEALVGTS